MPAATIRTKALALCLAKDNAHLSNSNAAKTRHSSCFCRPHLNSQDALYRNLCCNQAYVVTLLATDNCALRAGGMLHPRHFFPRHFLFPRRFVFLKRRQSLLRATISVTGKEMVLRSKRKKYLIFQALSLSKKSIFILATKQKINRFNQKVID